MIWLNNRVCGPVFPKVRETFIRYSDSFSHLGSLDDELVKAEDIIRNFTGFSRKEYAFRFLGNGGNIATSLFPAVFMNSLKEDGKNCFHIPATAETQFIETLSRMQSYGSHYDWVSTDENSLISEDTLSSSISPRSLLFSFSAVDGLTGLIQPTDKLFDVCHQRGILSHVEISHALGKIPLTNLHDKADFISFSGTSLNGIPGTGGLFIKKNLLPKIRLFFPESTEIIPLNVMAGNLALGTNIECLEEKYRFTLLEINRLRNLLEEGIQNEIPDTFLPFKGHFRVSDITTVYFKNVAAESLAFILSTANIFTALGNTIFQSLPQVLQASKENPLQSFSCLSFALSPFITEEDIFITVEKLKQAVTQLRKHVGAESDDDF